MFVSKTDGRLASLFEDSISPPVAGPAAGWPAPPLARNPDYPFLHPDSTYFRVVYSFRGRDGWKPAVGAKVRADWRDERSRVVTVPEDGIVVFECDGGVGEVFGPRTDRVEGAVHLSYLRNRHMYTCGTLGPDPVYHPSRYLAWRALDLAADTLQKHFGHTRGRINWKVTYDGGSEYTWNIFGDKITLWWGGSSEGRFRWVVAHEYGHALHHKALGGMWGTDKCGEEHRLSMSSITSYTCALSEGFADYAGAVGSVTADYPDGFFGECYEYLGTPDAPDGGHEVGEPWWCRDITHERKPEIEAWVAALFNDLIDDNDNLEGLDDDAEDDKTHYSGYYVAGVFKSCEAKRGRWPDRWKDRSKVYDFVWCLEEYVHKPTHERVFPYTGVPDTAKHERPPHRPKNWHWPDIRSTWLRNLAEEGR